MNLNRQRIINYARIVLSITIFSLLIYTVGFTSLVEHLSNISWINLLYAVILNFLYFLVSVISIWVLLARLYPHPFHIFFKCYIYALVINFFFPGQVGDFSIVYFLKKHDVPATSVSASYVIDKISVLSVYSIVAWYGINLLLFKIHLIFFIGIPVICILTALSIYIVLAKFEGRNKYINRAILFLKRIKGEVWTFGKYWYILILNLFFSVIKWVLISLFVKYAFHSLNESVPWPEVGIVPIISTLIGYIPITVGGIGTVEYSAMYLFERIGVTGSVVLTVYLLMRSLQYLQAGFLLLYVQLFHPNKDGSPNGEAYTFSMK